MEAMEPAWLQAIHPRTATAKEGSVKGAFQYNGGHGLTTFFVNVELAEPLRQQLAGQGLDPVDTVAFCQQAEGGWIAAFADEAMTKKVEFSLEEGQMQALMEANGIRLMHV
ncbi:hypothetical protein [Gemmiger sp. An50]|uniref:hypothetical protein n=1 Tax=Gemmiger sp. An50 TaxID=1965639 RepID=UPI000B38837F|nr:hypothetical protein [Gemmiger sp. An50]OUN86669.1 hypothetical protein B5G03_07355 [Gemmiger sp. An50]